MKTKMRGQALTEFALILPILLLLILGIVEGARIVWAYITVQNAAREAARYAVAGQPLNANGDPWTLGPEARDDFIKNKAVERAYGLGYTGVVTSTYSDYDASRTDAGVLAVAVWGLKTGTDTCSDEEGTSGWCRDYAGKEGLNVRVEVYYNVIMLDPIYAALVPNGYVHVVGETLMQNEGLSSVLGSQPPGGFPGDDGSPDTGTPPDRTPTLTVQGGYDWRAGDTIYILLSFHTPGTHYVYSNIPGGCATPCYIGTVNVDETGMGLLPYLIPVDTPAGSYVLQSRPATDPASVADEKTVNVTTSLDPVILTFGDRWPLGSPLRIGLAGHVPNTPYEIRWGLAPTPDYLVGSIPTDGAGNAAVGSLTYMIGSQPGDAPGTYLVSSGLATRTILVLAGCIKVNRGDCGETITVPAGTRINILLQNHAPARAYRVEFNGVEVPGSPVTTSAQGEAFLTYTIPDLTSNGTYTIRSVDGASVIASVNIVVDTPLTPFISVAGGYTWPAGSSFDYRLRNHTPNGEYDIYWEGTKIVTRAQVDATGSLWLNFTIPLTTPEGTNYTLASYLWPSNIASDSPVAESPDITVTAEPYLVIAEGSPQLPGSTIHIELYNHEPNSPFDIYFGNIPVPNGHVTTDLSGFYRLAYTIPANLAGGEYLVESRKGANVVASATLELVKADIQVQSIVAPANPTFNQNNPITVTIINASPVAITHQSFDVDIYMDPEPEPPDLGHSLPPGQVKEWVQPPLGVGQTATFTTTIPLFGAFDHHVWVRADTSGRVAESDETNNLGSLIISPVQCTIEYTSGSTSWSAKAFGDAAPAAGERVAGSLVLTSTGLSVEASHTGSDHDNTRGYYLIHQSQSGDFEVQARLASRLSAQTSYFGVEVRQSTAGNAPKVMWGLYTDNNLRYRYRTTSASGGGNITAASLPVWVRVVRTGNTFNLYSANTPGAWSLRQTRTVAMSNPVLVGLFVASYDDDNNGVVEIDNYRVCTAGSDCSAGNVLYEPTYDGSLDAGWSQTVFGDVTVPSYTAAANTVTITSGGDNFNFGVANDADNGGHYYLYQTLSGDFDVRVKAASRSNLQYNRGATSTALDNWTGFGLSLRASLADTADRLGIYRTYGRQVRVHQRVSGTGTTWAAGNSDQPVWLRITRSGSEFTFYYSYSAANPPNLADWIEHQRLTVPSMPENLYVGLANASGKPDATITATFTDYHVCGDPGGLASCGEVREAAGQVVVNAINYTANIPRSGQEWRPTGRNGKAGMAVPNAGTSYGGTYRTTAPELQYGVDFTNSGTYYVWILGSQPNDNGDFVTFGLDNNPVGDLVSGGANDQIVWFTSNPKLSVTVGSPGPHTLNVWVREDGFELYQILLSQDAAFDPTSLPDPLGVRQSACSAAGSIPMPPGLQQCNQVIQNGRFEDDSLMALWKYAGIAEQVTRTSVPHYLAAGESFSMLLPAENVSGIPRHPWLYQEFVMPSWVITPSAGTGGTHGTLTLRTGVNPRVAPAQADPLYVVLRNQTGNITVTNQITIAHGAETTTLNPFPPPPSNPVPPPPSAYDNNNWVLRTTDLMNSMVAAGHNPVDYANQTMQLYFYSPNPAGTYRTRFYIDNVELNICTAEPAPPTVDTLVKGKVRVFLDGVPTPQPGIFVWIYAIDGAMNTTYTIQDSTYSFYNLPAASGGTQYIVYAEYWDQDNNLYTASSTVVLRPGDRLENVDLLLF